MIGQICLGLWPGKFPRKQYGCIYSHKEVFLKSVPYNEQCLATDIFWISFNKDASDS